MSFTKHVSLVLQSMFCTFALNNLNKYSNYFCLSYEIHACLGRQIFDTPEIPKH